MAAVPSAAPAVPSLAALRRTIDSIDDAVHDLLMQRADVVGEVARAKALERGPAGVFRPGREAEVLRRLVARHRGPLPAETIVQLWREIMVASNRLQGPLSIAVGDPACAELARAHFGGVVLRRAPSAAALIAAVAKGRAQLGVLPLSGWWHRRPADVRILAGLPFVRTAPARKGPDAVVIGRQDFEPSSDDALFVAVTWETGAAHRPKLPAARVVAKARRAGRPVSLIETTASYSELRAALGSAGTVEFLGGYARPIVLPAAPKKRPPARRRR